MAKLKEFILSRVRIHFLQHQYGLPATFSSISVMHAEISPNASFNFQSFKINHMPHLGLIMPLEMELNVLIKNADDKTNEEALQQKIRSN